MISVLDSDFTSLNEFISAVSFSKVFILCDENTHEYCLPTLLGNLEIDIPFEIIEIEPGEDLKTIETAVQLWEILTEFQADKKALLINLGGGVITDLGGFVASTYKRGISFVNIPTSLLGMCDAAIGGKTGIDHGFLKNIVGTFCQPEKIFLYSPFLKSLPFDELRSGFAEMLKHGLIADKIHWEALVHTDINSIEKLYPLVLESMKIKESVVNQDFKEQNVRKNLNFGHTVGHAVESLFLHQQNPIKHGEAVVIGMIVETRLSFLEGLIDEECSEKIILNLQKLYPYISINDFDNKTLISLMMNDKKNENSKINFSLIEEIGKGKYNVQCRLNSIEEALNYYKNLE